MFLLLLSEKNHIAEKEEVSTGNPGNRGKGYGRQLLAMALRENEPKDMMLLVDFDNVSAINLYESMGFVKKENGNLLTAYWHVTKA